MKKLQINLGNKTFYTIIAIAIIMIVAGVVIAYNTNPANPAVMGHTANEIQGGGNACYPYYSNSTTSCNCPTGETKTKDLGVWGYCNYYWPGNENSFFRPYGLSCEDIWPFRPEYRQSVDMGLACICC